MLNFLEVESLRRTRIKRGIMFTVLLNDDRNVVLKEHNKVSSKKYHRKLYGFFKRTNKHKI